MTGAEPVRAGALQIREPRESEFAACRMLLPDACAQPTDRVFRLVFESTGSSIVAALSYLDDTQVLTGVHLHVVKKRRRSGIGSQLIQHILDEAQRLGRSSVLVDADLKKEPEAEAFLTARGFRSIGRLTSVGGPLLGLGPKRELFRARVAGAPDLPPTSRMVAISEAPPDQILQLYAEHIANMPILAAGMHRTFNAAHYPESVVLMIDGQVIGFILAQVMSNTVRVPALVVRPEYRGRRIAVRLIAVLEDQVSASVDRSVFEFADSAIFTKNLAATFGHEVFHIIARFERKTRSGGVSLL